MRNPYFHDSPLRASSQRSERAYGSIPTNRGKNTTLLAGLSLEGIGAAMTVEGSTTQKVFEVYVEKVLAPTLKPGQVVVLDNLGAHKGEKVRELIEARAASVIFLPAYSPDFNPIEEAFSKIKARHGPQKDGSPCPRGTHRGDRESAGSGYESGRLGMVCSLRVCRW